MAFVHSTSRIQRVSATENGGPVIGYACHNGRNQLWGLDNKERYRSRVEKDRCLSVDNASTLTVRSCNDSLNQKWVWDGEKLRSRYQDGSNKKYSLGLVDDQPKLVEEGNTNIRWKPYLQNPK